jgi:cytochrome c556
MWILIGAVVIIATIQFFMNRHFKRDVARLSANLKKVEIKFSKYHQDQVDAYKQLYTHFYEFRAATQSILYFAHRDADHDIYKKKLQGYLVNQKQLIHFFKSNRILFPEDTCKKIDDNFAVFARFTSKVFNDKENLENFETHFDADFMEMYGSAEGEMDKIKQKARNLRESEEYREAGKKIWQLIQELENDFRKLVK